MKNSKKAIGLTAAAACVTIIAITLVLYYPQKPRTSLITQPENTTIGDVRKPVVPSNESSIVTTTEQASFTRNEKEVNVTVVQTPNESVARYLFEMLKAGYLAQGLSSENLTLSNLAIKLYSADRSYLILLAKGKYVAISASNDESLAVDAAKAQANNLK